MEKKRTMRTKEYERFFEEAEMKFTSPSKSVHDDEKAPIANMMPSTSADLVLCLQTYISKDDSWRKALEDLNREYLKRTKG